MMCKKLLSIALFLVLAFALQAGSVPIVRIKGAINPVSANYIIQHLDEANDEGAECFIIALDTPGGLLTSTEDLTREIMNSDVPVVIYVHPVGGRAASAGVFIAYSAHIVAMAPGTRIGAAHPVTMGGGNTDSSATMMEKVANDGVANLKSMAKERGRNIDWVENAVLSSESIPADSALALGVIDLVAEDLETLIEKLDGQTYGPEDSDTLILDKPQIDEQPMSKVEKFLFTILNPNIAYMLMLLGIAGIYLELQNPGGILPGVVGVISILLALYAFQILPVNYVGIALIVVALGLFVAEAYTPTFGLFTTGGAVAMLSGSFLLTSGNPAFFSISWKIIIPSVIFVVVVIIIALWKAVQARISQPASGKEGLVGERGLVARQTKESNQYVFVEIHGELWRAKGNVPLEPGDQVTVKKVENNIIMVDKT